VALKSKSGEGMQDPLWLVRAWLLQR